jgi:hypothetical protein
MKLSVFVLVASALLGCQSTLVASRADAALVSRSAFDGSSEPFVHHDSYLSMALPYSAYSLLFEDVQKNVSSRQLINRGEAHITVLTPPEFAVLKSKVTMAEIDDLANKMGIQQSKIEPICIGRGQATIDGVDQQTYFVVVAAENLLSLREQLALLFTSRGGSLAAASGIPADGFVASHFLPHVTIGFTKADLFEQQGVVKDRTSCVEPLELN